MWDLEHSGSLDSKDLLLFTTSCKFRGDCSAFPLREFLKVLHTRTLEHPIPLGILAVVLPLGQAFVFTVSTGLLASSTMGETAHLTGSSCHSGRLCKGIYLSCWQKLQLGREYSEHRETTEGPRALRKAAISGPSSMLCEASVTSGWL